MKTVLLIDDDLEFHRLVVPALEMRGLRVLKAQRAAEANAILRREKPDLVVIDGLLPDADGMTWIRKYREGGAKTPVVFVSAFWKDLTSFNRLTRDLRVNLVLHKPVLPTAFAQEIEARLIQPDLSPGGLGPGADEPSGKSPPPAEDPFASLRVEYGAALPIRLEELAHAFHQLVAHPSDALLLGEAKHRAHRLRGTAGSYGFPEVGDAAGQLEDELEAVSQGSVAARLTAETALAKARYLAQKASGLPTGGTPRLVGPSVLVVGPESFTELAARAARQHLLEVRPARRSRDALVEARARRPSAALIALPIEDALALARELRTLPGCEALPLGLAAGPVDPRQGVAAVHAGASLLIDRNSAVDELGAALLTLAEAYRVGQRRVLLVDDDPDFRRRSKAVLEQADIAVSGLSEGARLLEAMEEASPDLLLLDVNLPALSGLDLCRLLRASPRWQDVPVVMVTANARADARLAAFQAGADDYLVKPVLDEELLARVRVRVERVRMLREKYDRDPLTGLLLRRPLIEAVRARLLEASRHDRPLALALLDLDKFKQVNDTHGHLAGDSVLAALGSLVQRRFRAEDLRGRWGGEEIVLVFPGETAESIQGAVSRLLQEFTALEFRSEAGKPFRAAFSAGVASFPGDGRELDELLRRADARLYLAKGQGRGRVIWR